MTDIKTGLWQNNLDGSYIKVKTALETQVTCSDECCADTYVMSKDELINCYRLVEADKPAPVVDDTFNDDTPAQTFGGVSNHLSSTPFGDIKWDIGTDEKCEAVMVIPCPSCDRAVPYDRHGALFLIGKVAVCSDCYAKNNREDIDADKQEPRKHAHYFKNISDFDEMDTYLFCRVWKVKDDSGALHHALKKLMDAGKRGNKDKIKDVTEARDTLNRYLEIEAMFTEVSE